MLDDDAVENLTQRLKERREDPEFMERLQHMVDEDRELLDRLAGYSKPPAMTTTEAAVYLLGTATGQLIAYKMYRRWGAPKWAAWGIAVISGQLAFPPDKREQALKVVTEALDKKLNKENNHG